MFPHDSGLTLPGDKIMNTNLLQLTPNDAYAFRRVLSKMDVPDDLNLSPLASLLLNSLDPQNNPAG